MKRSADAALPSFAVHLIGDAQCVGVDLDDGVEGRTIAIDRLDPRQILLGKTPRRILPAGHARL